MHKAELIRDLKHHLKEAHDYADGTKSIINHMSDGDLIKVYQYDALQAIAHAQVAQALSMTLDSSIDFPELFDPHKVIDVE
jgi:hypothetical protein